MARFKNVDWPDVEARIKNVANQYKAVVVVDVGHGGGFGGSMFDYLKRALGKDRVYGVKTGNLATKAEICETMISAIQNRHIQICDGAHSETLKNELLWFEVHREVSGGVERIRYNGPQGPNDHDDCVISLALANWGRLHAYENVWRRKPADLRQFMAPAATSEYRFRMP